MPPLADLRLAVMVFPQQWDGATLALNLLLVPSVDPLLQPVAGSAAAFADHVPDLQVVVIPNLDTFPTTTDSTAVRIAPTIVAPAPPAAPRPMFERLELQATAQGSTVAPLTPPAAPPVARIRKALPESYLTITGGHPDGELTTTTHDYECDLNAQAPGTVTGPPPSTVSWGQLISYALRQPLLANALGLRYELTIPVAAGDLALGGWVFVELDPSDPWATAAAPTPGAVRLYAARLPALEATARPVFGAVLFPVDAGGAPTDPEAVSEADTYDAGFAQIVHSHQPEGNDAVTGNPSALPAPVDPGVQLGWDDEQVVAWTNRQIGMLAARAGGSLDAETPLGVLGYRVDVADITGRHPADTSPLPWESLMAVATALPFNLGATVDELLLEPAPVRMNETTTDAWLPHYFANWRGGCIAVADDVPNQMLGQPATTNPNTPEPVTTLLSYGRAYAFRVRLSDLSHGGPSVDQLPVTPGPADVTTRQFVRMTPPKAVPVRLSPGRIDVTRPVIGYPEVLYTALGATAVDRAAIVSHYVTHAGTIDPGSGDVAGLPDPDVAGVRIVVEVATPAHDVAGPGGTIDGTYRVLYTTTRALPALPAGPTPVDPGVTIDLAYVDAPSITDWAPAGWPDTGPLVVPRGRHVHLRVEPLLREEPGYFGAGAAKVLTTTVELRAEPRDEPSLLVPNADGGETVRGLFFRRPPGIDAPPVAAQLAQVLRLVDDGLTLTAQPGHRVVFGASMALRHELTGDGGSITIASQSELLRNWIVALDVELDRDWTWTGLDGPITVKRDGNVVGSIMVPFVASPAAVAEPAHWERRRTRLVFLDAVDPHEPTKSGFPEAQPHTWTLTAPLKQETGAAPGVAGTPTFVPGHLPGQPQHELNKVGRSITLPIAIPPKQVPQLASVGLALSPYSIGPGYASTGDRRRALWLELREPVDNAAGDALFARVIGHGADPLLYDPTPSTEAGVTPPMTLDPELVRLVVENDSDDRAGIGAMVQLERATDSDVHYLLPLPPGLTADSPELFGFWTWELRIGHAGDPHAPGQKWWSTAQGRFGRALRVNGVQHPAPPLACRAGRIEPLVPALVPAGTTLGPASPLAGLGGRFIEASAPHATPVLHGRPLVTPFDMPKTTMCFLLYAQVVQADGSSNRNVLLQRRYGRYIPARERPRDHPGGLSDTQRDRISRALFETDEVEALLHSLGLPTDSPLSVLAVELLPGGSGAGNLPKDNDFVEGAAAEDPLGHDLLVPEGRPQRILRVSPLVPVAPAC